MVYNMYTSMHLQVYYTMYMYTCIKNNSCIYKHHMLTYELYASISVSCEVGLGVIWDAPVLPGNTIPETRQIGCGQEPLVVVPVSDDVDGTGEDDHPGNGLVEGQVLVQQTLDGARWALDGRRTWQVIIT